MEQKPELTISGEQYDNLQYGFVKLYRSITKHWLWQDERKLKWWIWILVEVNHQDTKVPIGFDLIECKRGQSVKSLETWAKDFRIDKSTVRRFFSLLQQDAMIVLENLQKTTRLTVCNYEIYNDQQHREQLQSNSEATPTQLQSNSNKKYKNGKNGKNIGIRPKGLTLSLESDRHEKNELKKNYETLVTGLEGKDHTACWIAVKDFIHTNKPGFIEPYVDAWNLFALNYRLQKGPIRITAGRREKFDTRIEEPGFDFLEILSKIKSSGFLQGKNERRWKVSFDFIFKNEDNYTKILEEKYDFEWT